MTSQTKVIRLFHRHVNFNSTSKSRRGCEKSLKHSLRISLTTESVKNLEWNPDLTGNNLLFTNNKLYRLNRHITDDQRWKILLGIAPKAKVKNHRKYQTQHRQYRHKLKKLVKSERARGNEQGAKFIESIVNEKDKITRVHLKDIQVVGLSRLKQRMSTIKKYAISHNILCHYPPSSNSTVVQEGIFKIPHKWNVTSNDISLVEYIAATKQFLEQHFPDHSIKAIVGHDDERSSNETTGMHTHYFLAGRNNKTGEYDLRKRQILLVNEYITKQRIEDELLPIDGKLSHAQSRSLGHYWQCLVQTFMNTKLLNPKGLDAEFTEETEKKTERYQSMLRQAKLPKSQRDFNYQTRLMESLTAEVQELKDERADESDKFDAMVSQLDTLHANLKLKADELEEIERKTSYYQLELQEATNRYIYYEERLLEKNGELAQAELLLAEKEAQLVGADQRTKQLIKEILVDAYMLMQAKHKKYPRAVREFTEQIAEKLDFDVSAEIRQLLLAADIDLDLFEKGQSNRNSRGRER
ncbi:hypothetical protein [Vibrio fluminensis]|uniref:hypothetical protein n=1 Tax=Vibrio fluminensis TaxID=2783614 RepID=UPI001887B91F|nr:hypothetical protein [Vibrio fluminensis]